MCSKHKQTVNAMQKPPPPGLLKSDGCSSCHSIGDLIRESEYPVIQGFYGSKWGKQLSMHNPRGDSDSIPVNMSDKMMQY